MISNMKSDQAKFNIEINNDKKFEQPNFDRLCGGSNPAWFSDCQEKGKNRYSKTQQQKFHLWASFYKLQTKNIQPLPVTSILSLFSSLKILFDDEKDIIAAKNQKIISLFEEETWITTWLLT